MKKVLIVVAVVFLAGIVNTRASTNTFEVTITGIIKGEGVAPIKVTTADLLSSSTNDLAVVFDTDNNYWELDEVSIGATNAIVHTITEGDSFAMDSKGDFIGDLYTYNNGLTFSGGVPQNGGDIFVSGKVKLTGAKPTFTSKLDGVWKDRTYPPKGTLDYTIKGGLKSTGTITTPSNY